MGAGIAASPSLKGFGSAYAKCTGKGIAGGAEIVESKIGHLTSYARNAIHIGEFSSSIRKWRSAHVIKLRQLSQLR
jgi:hypothetical protein